MSGKIQTLKEWRIDLGMSQKELSQKAGVTERSIQIYERDIETLERAAHSTIMSICAALGVEPKQILTRHESADQVEKKI